MSIQLKNVGFMKKWKGMKKMFQCDQCGACCRNLDLNPVFSELNRGDGICRFLSGNLCSIYETRPLICRVDEVYELFWKDQLSRERYYQMNSEIYNQLKRCVPK